MVDRVGQRLGNYRLLRLVGRGGFADVYLGEHIHLRTQAAIKVLQLRLGENNEQNFLNEARMIAHLVHPYIIRVLDFGVQENIPFLVMDYAPRGTFRQRFLQGRPLPPTPLFPYIKQAATALQYAHDKKLIHRDVKPENMLIGPNDEVLLSDFGFALMQTSIARGASAETAGTAAYMAPEQLQGRPCPASDQYALGIVAYEWLTGDCPFHGTFFEIASQHMLTPPPALHEKIPAISPELEQVVMTALAKDPAQRFPTVRDFATALERACLSSKTMLPGQPPPPFEQATQSGVHPPLPGNSVPGNGASPVQNTFRVATNRMHAVHPSQTTAKDGISKSFPALGNTGVHPNAAPQPSFGANNAPGHRSEVQRAMTNSRFDQQADGRQPPLAERISQGHIPVNPPSQEPPNNPTVLPSRTFPRLARLSQQLSPEQQARLHTNGQDGATSPSGTQFQAMRNTLPGLSTFRPEQNSLTGLRPLAGDSPQPVHPSASMPGLAALSPRSFAAPPEPPAGAAPANSPVAILSGKAEPPSQGIAGKLERSRNKVSNGMVVFLALMIVFIIGGSLGLITLANNAHRNGRPDDPAVQTQIAQKHGQTATAQANASATSASIATATAQVNANPYPPNQGMLSINNSLNANDPVSQWDEDAHCIFADGSYHARAATDISWPCYASGRSFYNFTYEVQMNFAQTSQAYSSGGIIFRANKDSGNFYLFMLFSSGRFLFEKCTGVTNCTVMVNGSQTAAGKALPPLASFKANQTNTLAVVAVGSMMTLFVNGQKAFDRWEDTTGNTYTQGMVGVFVHGGTDDVVTDVAFTQARLWK